MSSEREIDLEMQDDDDSLYRISLREKIRIFVIAAVLTGVITILFYFDYILSGQLLLLTVLVFPKVFLNANIFDIDIIMLYATASNIVLRSRAFAFLKRLARASPRRAYAAWSELFEGPGLPTHTARRPHGAPNHFVRILRRI
ncbi:hypothetical protein F5B18DRAFT_666405 [Nemania serpens]|nr:hypothetical protein F5B18DRAFT_666405 [Nemania serpens]